jgi:hypothetical protein
MEYVDVLWGGNVCKVMKNGVAFGWLRKLLGKVALRHILFLRAFPSI